MTNFSVLSFFCDEKIADFQDLHILNWVSQFYKRSSLQTSQIFTKTQPSFIHFKSLFIKSDCFEVKENLRNIGQIFQSLRSIIIIFRNRCHSDLCLINNDFYFFILILCFFTSFHFDLAKKKVLIEQKLVLNLYIDTIMLERFSKSIGVELASK